VNSLVKYIVPKEKGIVYGTGAWEIGDILTNPAMKLAHEMGKDV
jgi:hypothetical protein